MAHAVRSALAAMLAGAAVSACREGIHEPQELAAAVAVVISNPVVQPTPAVPASRGPAMSLVKVGGSAFVSMSPGTQAAGTGAAIANRRTRESVQAPMRDGGFDPVGITAGAGDTFDITIALSTGDPVLARAIVPARRSPRVVRTYPSRGKTDVALNPNVMVIFSEPIDRATLQAIRLLRDGAVVAGSVGLAAGSRVAVEFVPGGPLLPATEYQLVIGDGIKDLSGDRLQEATTVPFTTVAAGTAPQPAVPHQPSEPEGPPQPEQPPQPPPTGLEPVSGLAVTAATVVTAGGTLDADGYEIGIDGAPAQPIGINGAVVVPGLAAGNHVVTLGGISDGCRVLGSRSRQVEMPSVSASALVLLKLHFSVACGSTPSEPVPQLSGTLAFVSHRDGNPDIYTVGADGTGLVRLTNNAANDAEPAWSPDGTRIAFTSDRGGEYHIYVMNADGSNVVRLTNAERFNMSPAWSPDGRTLAFSSFRNGEHGIYLMSLDGESSPRLGFPRGWTAGPAWSPDGRRIAFTSDWRAFDFTYDVYAMNADGTGMTPLFMGPFPDGYWGGMDHYQPAWSPDGSSIAAVACPDGWFTCYPSSSIVIASADGSSARTLVDISGSTRLAWSPDGAAIAYSSKDCGACASSLRYVTAGGTRTGVILTDGESPSWRR